MLKHYIVQAVRSFWRFRVTTLVNLAGLVLALICFITTYLVMEDLLRSDIQFPKARRIYAVTQELWSSPGQRMIPAFPRAGPPTAKYLRTDFPALEAVARAIPVGVMGAATEDRSISAAVVGADPDFLRIFDLDFKAGAARNALTSTHSAILTEQTAERLFGRLDVVGRHMLIQNRIDVTITAVVATIPKPTHMGDDAGGIGLLFNVLVPMNLLPEFTTNAGIGVPIAPEADTWAQDIYFTYVLFPANGSITPQEVRRGLADFSARRVPKDQLGSVFGLVPLSHINLSVYDAILSNNSSLSLITTISLLDTLILAIACLNYANLAVAIATTRAKEIGMRKILGASRLHLMRQYLVEAALLGGVAIVIVLIGAMLAIEPINQLLNASVHWSALLRPGLWALVAGLIAAVALIGGAYPALVLSQVRPVESLRAGTVRAGPRFVPTALVGVQFAAASFLLVVALLMLKQNAQIEREGIRPERDPVVVLNNDLRELHVSLDTLRAELLRSPYIKSVSASVAPPWQNGGWHQVLSRSPTPGAPQETTIYNQVSYDFFATLDMKLLAGRLLDRDHGDEFVNFWSPRPSGKEICILVDRSLARALGFGNPNDIVNQIIYDAPSPADTRPPFSYRVVGVVEDGYPRLIGPNTTSNMYGLTPTETGITLVRISRENVKAALEHIDATWASLVPKAPLRRAFIDALFEDAYAVFSRVSTVLSGLAGFAFFIAVMGLCGMAIHVTSRRRREIGIRKTLGASARGVVMMLLRDFSKPVIIANVVAWPFAYFAGRAYLDAFTNGSSMSVWPFALSLVITLVIAWAAVGVQAMQAAAVKPANVLHTE
jgi:putative ABC transport system permease protein